MAELQELSPDVARALLSLSIPVQVYLSPPRPVTFAMKVGHGLRMASPGELPRGFHSLFAGLRIVLDVQQHLTTVWLGAPNSLSTRSKWLDNELLPGLRDMTADVLSLGRFIFKGGTDLVLVMHCVILE